MKPNYCTKEGNIDFSMYVDENYDCSNMTNMELMNLLWIDIFLGRDSNKDFDVDHFMNLDQKVKDKEREQKEKN